MVQCQNEELVSKYKEFILIVRISEKLNRTLCKGVRFNFSENIRICI